MNQPLKDGSSLLSVDEMYTKVRSYKQNLQENGQAGKRLYFAKVDVTSAFDNLPQSRLLEIVRDLLPCGEYDIARYAELRSLFQAIPAHAASKPIKKFYAEAEVAGNFQSFENRLLHGKKAKTNHIFSDNVVHQPVKSDQTLDLLKEHVVNNIVKIGKKFYRQKRGVPQGSILSTILCNFCYAAFEEKNLHFLRIGDSLLLRLIDDFLVITQDRHLATRFVKVMHTGDESYGVSVKHEKSLVNFDVKVGDRDVAKLQNSSTFPFCGMLLDQQSLEITKDTGMLKRGRMNTGPWDVHTYTLPSIGPQDALTAEYSKMPGNTFRRKMTKYVSAFPYLRSTTNVALQRREDSYAYDALRHVSQHTYDCTSHIIQIVARLSKSLFSLFKVCSSFEAHNCTIDRYDSAANTRVLPRKYMSN